MPKFITYQRPAPVNKNAWGKIKGPTTTGSKGPPARAEKKPALPALFLDKPKVK